MLGFPLKEEKNILIKIKKKEEKKRKDHKVYVKLIGNRGKSSSS